MRLLLVEDDEIVGDGLKTGLTLEGYAVDWVTDGFLADEALKTSNYELIILDLNLPGKQGIDILTDLRKRQDPTPVLILTASDALQDKVAGLDKGADDFVIKPFDLAEVCARLRALFRRQVSGKMPVLEHKGIRLDPASHHVEYKGKKIELSQQEFKILRFLLNNIGHVASRARLEEALYAWDSEVESNTIEVHIHHLRKKIDGKFIRTIRGVGYIIDQN